MSPAAPPPCFPDDVASCDAMVLLALDSARQLPLLPALFGRVLVPSAVQKEIEDGRAVGMPGPDGHTLAALGVIVVPVQTLADLEQVKALDAGEREALSLATALGPAGVLISDDNAAVTEAKRRGLRVLRTGAVLNLAKRHQHIPLVAPVLDEMVAKGFRLSREHRRAILEVASESDDDEEQGRH